ncbi:MAG: DUF4468 domain-containing protein [Bacteroidetes bacterium]|nr:DUF4468 domain-containing protein [Bacteroidota bacterium]
MKAFLLGVMLISLGITARTQDNKKIQERVEDSIKLIVDTNGKAYYQKMVKVDSTIKLSTIYTRVLEFMAARNFQQTYGYEQEGKLIFTTAQDLNMNAKYELDNDDPETYSVQFSITIDMRNGRYRYTVSNIIFYLGSQSGNRRMPLHDLYLMETNADSRRIEKNARKLIDSFETYLTGLLNDLHLEILHKAPIYNQKF